MLCDLVQPQIHSNPLASAFEVIGTGVHHHACLCIKTLKFYCKRKISLKVIRNFGEKGRIIIANEIKMRVEIECD